MIHGHKSVYPEFQFRRCCKVIFWRKVYSFWEALSQPLSALSARYCTTCPVCITAVSAGGERLGESFLRKTKGWAVRSKSDIYSLGQGLHWVTYDVVESQHFMTYCLDRDIQRKSMQESIVVQVLSTIILVQYKGGIPSFLSQNIGTFDTKISTKSKCANAAPRYHHSAVSQLIKRKIVFVI